MSMKMVVSLPFLCRDVFRGFDLGEGRMDDRDTELQLVSSTKTKKKLLNSKGTSASPL